MAKIQRWSSFARRIGFPLALLTGLLVASPAYALYQFYLRRDLRDILSDRPDDLVDQQVTFTDELLVVWPPARERPDRRQEFVLFDTKYFHCAVPKAQMGEHLQTAWNDAQRGYKDALAQLEDINDRLHDRAQNLNLDQAQAEREKLYRELFRVWANRPIVTVFGKVSRANFWGAVSGPVQTERITILVDKVERPRTRWYDEGLDSN